MKSEEENTEALKRALLREAQADAEQIQAEGAAKADVIRKQAQVQADAERQAILARAVQDAERLRSQVVASAQLKARTVQLEYREKLLDQVFNAARQKLPALKQRSDYIQIAHHLLREALTELRVAKAQIRADAATQKLLNDDVVEKISKELNTEIMMGAPLEEGTGVVVETSDGHLHYDNTLETRLSRLQGSLRSSVYHVLMGELL